MKPRRRRVASSLIAALGLLGPSAACTLDFDRFDRGESDGAASSIDAASPSTEDVTSAADVSSITDDAARGSTDSSLKPVPEAAVDAAPDASTEAPGSDSSVVDSGCADVCISDLQSCVASCGSVYTQCTSLCTALGSVCTNACNTTQQTCESSCNKTCTRCAQKAACAPVSICSDGG